MVKGGGMAKFLARRIAAMFASMMVIIVLTFLLMHSIPGGPFTSDLQMEPAVEQAIRAKYHLDDPLWRQFL
ncbi:MAG: peptide ABC transporter permease, partial [Propionibacteriales bacterium]